MAWPWADLGSRRRSHYRLDKRNCSAGTGGAGGTRRRSQPLPRQIGPKRALGMILPVASAEEGVQPAVNDCSP